MKVESFHPFRSELARQEYLAFYDHRAEGWSVPSETKMVATSFGQTFVRISGVNNSSPHVLLPASVDAPMTTIGRDYLTRISCQFEGKEGLVVLDQIRTVDKIRLVKKLGKINTATQKVFLVALWRCSARKPGMVFMVRQ